MDDDHGHALFFQGFDLAGQGAGAQPTGAAHGDPGPVEEPGDPLAGGLGNLLGGRGLRGGGGNGGGQRVGGVGLQRRGPAEDIRAADAVGVPFNGTILPSLL